MMNNRKGKIRMEEDTTLYLPHELIILILLWLPAKSLIRFKSVCKSWFSLISDPHFANSHFELTAKTHTHRRLIFMSNIVNSILSIDFEEPLDYDAAYVTSIPTPSFMTPQSDYYIEIISSCRGFVFLHRLSSYYLWNPSTGVERQIPLSPNESHDYANSFMYLYGFGYDELRDDYLVVMFYFDQLFNEVYSSLEFFSLRDNMWHVIEGTHFPDIKYRPNYEPRVGLVFNGSIHWSSMYVILAFDLIERKLLEMPFPNDFDHKREKCDLWVFREYFSLWAMGYDKLEIWVMKEYKVESSWTKTLILSIDAIPSRYFIPICSTKSGDIVGRDDKTGMLKYNYKGQLLEHDSLWDDPLFSTESQFAVYTESLLSLPGDNMQA